jgi:predicted glutamine amidotransferase
MCGICGYIGKSKEPDVTHQIITKLFEKSERRGIDAAGYWGVSKGNILYHKEPGKSSNFVKKNVWKLVCKHDPNLLLLHARGASKGVGLPSVNHNNHPFTSTDRSIALIHNGRVDDHEYNSLKQKYTLKTQCDSEILLRIFESGESYSDNELKKIFGDFQCPRLAGIKDIFSLINQGHMAVAIGERDQDNNCILWLFRNQHRPLWVVDMREFLGQIFFVSDPDIWEESIRELSFRSTKNLIKTQKLIELPIEEIWQFKINSEENHPKNFQRFKVYKKDLTPWSFDGKKHDLIHRETNSFEVISQLDKNEQIISDSEFPFYDLDKKCNDIINLIDNIRSQTEQLIQNGSIPRHDFDQLLQDLEQQKQLLTSIEHALI